MQHNNIQWLEQIQQTTPMALHTENQRGPHVTLHGTTAWHSPSGTYIILDEMEWCKGEKDVWYTEFKSVAEFSWTEDFKLTEKLEII